MKNLWNPEDKASIIRRINAVTPETQPLWGKMTANEMICHLADQLRLANGDVPTADRGNFFTKTIMKWGVLTIIRAPKGKVKTAPEIDQETAGTKPTHFEADKATLLKMIDEMEHYSGKLSPHPLFGTLNHHQWGRMGYTHMDHHLSQFGV